MRSKLRANDRPTSRAAPRRRWRASPHSLTRRHGAARDRARTMIDVHSHLLPGVDDGARSFEQSVGVLERFAGQGVECVVLTPHLNASRLADAPYDRHRELLADLSQLA